LARIGTAAIAARAACRRTATFAISLPSVVGLAVWPCVRARHRRERRDDAVESRQQRLAPRRVEHQRVAGVVDVLAGAREVEKADRARETGLGCEALAEPVLDRLDVVVGAPLDRLDRVGVGGRERIDEVVQERAFGGARRRQLRDPGVGQSEKPLDLDAHSAAHQAVLRQPRSQRVDLGGIAPVEGRQRGDGRGLHLAVVAPVQRTVAPTGHYRRCP